MKKFIFTLVFTLFAINLVAQKHMSFMGIPMDCSSEQFCKKLQAKGFKFLQKYNDYNILTGMFAGDKVMIQLMDSKSGKNIPRIGVFYTSSSEWKGLVNKYNRLKELYTKKYGEPSYSVEQNDAITDSNTSLMHNLSEGKAEYITQWRLENGWIALAISKAANFGEGFVLVLYNDKINDNAKEEGYLDDI